VGRILKFALPGLAALALSGCWLPRQYSRVTNNTGHAIQLTITVKTPPSPIYGPMNPGESMNVGDKPKDIIAIVYTYYGKSCRMDPAHIVAAAHPVAGGYQEIALKACDPDVR